MSANSFSIDVNPVVGAAPELYYRIESSDNQILKITEKAIRQSETLYKLIETFGYTPKNIEDTDPIPVHGCTGKVLELVFKWCEYHKEEPIPTDAESNPNFVVIPEFDKKLLDIDDTVLFHLIGAANYLNVRGLFNVSCKKVSNMAKNKNREQLRAIFGIKTDAEDQAAKKAAGKLTKEADEKDSVAEKSQ